MSARFDAIVEREGAKLRAAHAGISLRRPRCETLGGSAHEQYSVALDIRGPEFQELISGKPAPSIDKAAEAAFDEARSRLRARAARRQAPMRVVLACSLPQPNLEEAA